jgi:hypothetical protein
MPADLYWRIPSTFDIEKLVEQDPPSFLGKKKSRSRWGAIELFGTGVDLIFR